MMTLNIHALPKFTLVAHRAILSNQTELLFVNEDVSLIVAERMNAIVARTRLPVLSNVNFVVLFAQQEIISMLSKAPNTYAGNLMHAEICANCKEFARLQTLPNPLNLCSMENILSAQYTQEAKKSLCGILIPPNELTHAGLHMHIDDPDSFHFCEERCTHCGYYCTLRLGHPDDEHRTQHGSMENSEWLIEGSEDAILELQGRIYGTGDSGAPMLCSMVCKSLGRHVHISRCRAEDAESCNDPDVEHVEQKNALVEYDWISHKTFWARSGFEDPYTNAERADFELCDRRCGGEEHDPDINPGAAPSYCTLPLFHPPADPADAPGLGHVSSDGHAYNCKNPALMQRSFHIFFALDRSGSMTFSDHRPLPDTPATERIVRQADNRFGAVLSAVYNFWVARDTATRGGIAAGLRQDAYTVVFFDHVSTVACSNDVGSTPDDLLAMVPPNANYYGGTDFSTALQTIKKEMTDSWSTDRYPVVILLSDGECSIRDETVSDLCQTAVGLGKPLGFHTVSFGRQSGSDTLRRMAAVAKDVYDEAPEDPLAPLSGASPCTFNEALDSVQLADTFIRIATSLKNPRAALRA
ncbi:hypothetical protein FRC17_007455 [Serendipita sp. 399]|nr:hypothetical protein FRC17_007455 [Serendipita sp. 399]